MSRKQCSCTTSFINDLRQLLKLFSLKSVRNEVKLTAHERARLSTLHQAGLRSSCADELKELPSGSHRAGSL